MRALVAAVGLLGACAASSPPEPAAVATLPTFDMRELPVRSARARALVKRLEDVGLGAASANWPRRDALPKPEACYGAAYSMGVPVTCGAWWFDLLVDLENPRIIWVRGIGTIAGVVEYRGPAEVVGDSGPLELRVVE